jgi:hypothetical protein
VFSDAKNNATFVISSGFPILCTGICCSFSSFFCWFSTKDEPPLGTPYDDWVDKYWNWVISLSKEEATPKNGGCLINKADGCLINKADSMVMLMQTTFGGTHNQVCNISYNNTIMIPLWAGWRTSSITPGKTKSPA